MSVDSAIDSLLARACAGDSDALADLLRGQEPRVRAAIQAHLPRRWQALLSVEDVLQHTYTEAILRIRSFNPRGEAAFAVWIRKLAEHHVIEAVRALQAEKRGGKRHQVRLPDRGDSYAALFERLTGVLTQTTPSAGVARAELRETLERALHRLPGHYRLVVQRYDLESRPIGEIAAELGRSPGAIHLIRFRAHAQLRELLDGRATIFQNLP